MLTIENRWKFYFINIMKNCFRYWPSIMQLHWVATYLDPSFRDLCFVTDKSYRTTQLKEIKEGLITMAIDIENQQDINNSPVSYN